MAGAGGSTPASAADATTTSDDCSVRGRVAVSLCCGLVDLSGVGAVVAPCCCCCCVDAGIWLLSALSTAAGAECTHPTTGPFESPSALSSTRIHVPKPAERRCSLARMASPSARLASWGKPRVCKCVSGLAPTAFSCTGTSLIEWLVLSPRE